MFLLWTILAEANPFVSAIVFPGIVSVVTIIIALSPSFIEFYAVVRLIVSFPVFSMGYRWHASS